MLLEKISSIFSDPIVDEVLINADRSISFIKENQITNMESPFNDQILFIRMLQKFALENGVRLDPNSPSAGGEYLNSEYRWHAVIPPMSTIGGIFSMRRHRFDRIQFDDFCFVNDEHFAQLIHLFKSKNNILICGETGSGKTTLLATLLREFAQEERIIFLEALNELPLLSKTWIKFVERKANIESKGEISIKILMQECLRLRPDRIVVGEIRGGETVTFLDAITSGHGGVLATIHGKSKQDVVERIKLLLLKDKIPLAYAEAVLNGLKDLYIVVMERGRVPVIKDINLLN